MLTGQNWNHGFGLRKQDEGDFIFSDAASSQLPATMLLPTSSPLLPASLPPAPFPPPLPPQVAPFSPSPSAGHRSTHSNPPPVDNTTTLAHFPVSSSPHTTYPFQWNTVIRSSSHADQPDKALLTFSLMLSSSTPPDLVSFSMVLKACSKGHRLREGEQIHGLLLKTSSASYLFLQNCLISFYSKCGFADIARKVFDRMACRDSVSWNSMIDGYVKAGKVGQARQLFDQMGHGDRSLVTWNSMISGYAHIGSVEGILAARNLFDKMPKRDLISWNSMIDGYVKCQKMDVASRLFDSMPKRDVISWANMINGYMEIGSVEIARFLFDKMPEKDVISWNIMLSGYVKNGFYVEAMNLFGKMQTADTVPPDIVTLAVVLSAVAELGSIHDGISMHNYIRKNHLSLNGKLGAALIDMYAKCGQLDEALKVFQKLGRRSVDQWNAIICGLAIHGFGRHALRLFSEMLNIPLRPDDITFIGILNACSHSGLVKEGLDFFEKMRRQYCLKPKVQHYGCMVDILGRAGRLEEARKMIEEMPIQPNDVILRSLLSACRNHGNIEIGLIMVQNLIDMGSCNSSSYTLLCSIYSNLGLSNDANKVREKTKENDIRKIHGCSWIELDGVVHEFVVGDRNHTEARKIYSLLNNMRAITLFCLEDG